MNHSRASTNLLTNGFCTQLHALLSIFEGNTVVLSSGQVVPFGVCVWSTGNTALDFVRDLGLAMSKDDRILVDGRLRVNDDVYAMGDCAVDPDNPLPMIAQVAKQQAVYLSRVFNKGVETPFKFLFMGSMTQLGTWQGVVQVSFFPSTPLA